MDEEYELTDPDSVIGKDGLTDEERDELRHELARDEEFGGHSPDEGDRG